MCSARVAEVARVLRIGWCFPLRDRPPVRSGAVFIMRLELSLFISFKRLDEPTPKSSNPALSGKHFHIASSALNRETSPEANDPSVIRMHLLFKIAHFNEEMRTKVFLSVYRRFLQKLIEPVRRC
jgi:hypothetical protein